MAPWVASKDRFEPGPNYRKARRWRPFLAQPAPVAQCPSGEVHDPATGVCMPIPAQGPLPEIRGIPCTGSNTGECIGLGEEQQQQPTHPADPPAGP